MESLIVSALVNGIQFGLRVVGEQIILDSYLTLKSSILRNHQDISIDRLERNPESKRQQTLVASQLKIAGIDSDIEIIQLAHTLVDLIAARKLDSNMSTNHIDPIDEFDRKGGYDAISELVEKHVNNVIGVSKDYPVQHQDLISSRFSKQQAVPANIKTEISHLHRNIRTIIWGIATRISERKYKPTESAVSSMQLGYVSKQRADQLISADKKFFISFQSLKTTVDLFTDLNQLIVQKINHSQSSQSQMNLLLGNAILVYELTDFLINFVDGFVIDGISEVSRLYEETKVEIVGLRQQQTKLAKMIEADDIEPEVREQVSEDIHTREATINNFETEWATYVDGFKSTQGEIAKIRSKLPTLSVIRENAKVQINLLQAVEILRILKQNSSYMSTAILTLEGIKLIPLSPNRLKRLLGDFES